MCCEDIKATPTTIRELIQRTRGRGNPNDMDYEVSLTYSGVELRKGYIEIYSSWGSETARLLERAGRFLISYFEDDQGGVYLKFDARAFRGIGEIFITNKQIPY